MDQRRTDQSARISGVRSAARGSAAQEKAARTGAQTGAAQKEAESYPEDRISHYTDRGGHCSVLPVETIRTLG